MKIRTDFVTNSSSSSFISIGVFDADLAEMFKKFKDNRGKVWLSGRVCGGVSINDGCVTITTELSEVDPWGSYKVNRIDPECYCSGDVDLFPSDSRKARTLDNIMAAFALIDINYADFDKNAMNQVLERAYREEKAIVKVYIDETDGFELQDFSYEELIPWNMEVDENNIITKYSERQCDNGELIFPDGVCGIKRGVLLKLKHTSKITVNSYAKMDSNLFEGIQCVEEVDLSAQYQSILPEGLFKNCTALKKVILPHELYMIKSSAFEGCTSLTEIVFPDTISYIEKDSFVGCDSLSKELREQISEIIANSVNFEKKVEEAAQYIRTHGDSGFAFGNLEYFSYSDLFKTVNDYKRWHEIYDEYFDFIEQICKGNFRYVVWASASAIENLENEYASQLEELKWRRTKEISGATNFLVVDSNNIPNFDRFLAKRRALDMGDIERAAVYGNNLLEKAIQIKKDGGSIKIITLSDFCELLKIGEFGEEALEIRLSDSANRVTKEEKAAQKAAVCEEMIASIVLQNKESGILFTNEEIIAKIDEFVGSTYRFEAYISQKHGKTIKDFFDELGVLKTTRTDFYALVDILKERYERKPRVSGFTELVADNADLDISIIAYNAKRLTGLPAREYLLSEGILALEEIKSMEELTVGVLYKPGNEPDNIKRRLATLFAKLDEAYPDKVIEGLNREHKKWGETVTDLYRLLGYANSKNFLMAYGYTVADNKGGRPKADNASTIEELKRRYPNGANFKNVDELMAANPDIAKKLNTLQKDAKQVLGISFGKWLKSVGLMGK